ncbi:MAG: translation initiation factor IF-2 N-terminal domain-containing protein, partial [Planctomycetota bacterium]|nr:translation initiation factor IF-2 N-terminal domain-containing protein [Planctomycetota bacterium]
AKSTVLPISEFGIVEMTRQRMRPNTKKANFDLCPTCEGTGEAPRPDSVAADALRRAGVVLENEQVRRIELVCSRSIANILSVDKKKEIELFEERSSRKIDVQVSENILEKRVDIYAYDEEGADVEINKQVRLKVPKIADLPTEIDPDDARNAKKSGKRRRRRGRGKNPPADATAIALSGGFDIDDEFEDELDASPDATGDSAEESSEEGSESGGRRKRRRRRRGRGRRRQELEAEQRELESKSIRIYALAKELGVTSKEILERCREAEGFDNLKNHMSSLEGDPLLEVRGWFRPEEPPVPEEEPGETEAGDGRGESPDDEDGKPRRRRRRRRGRRGRNRDQEDGGSSSEERAESSDDPGTDASGRTSDSPDGEDGEDRPRKRRRRRRGRGRRRSEDSPEQESGSNDEAGTDRESPDRGEKRPGAEDPPRESGSAGKDDGESGSTPETGSNSSSGEPAPEAPAKPKRRSLYGGRMRRVSNTGRPAED